MQRIDDRLARHSLKLSSSEALLSRRYRRSRPVSMDPPELSIMPVQHSALEGRGYASGPGSRSPQTTTIRFADSPPIKRPDKPRTRLENPYAPPASYHNPHPHVQSMLIRRTRSLQPAPIRTDLASRSITPSPSMSPKPLPPYPQESPRNSSIQMSRLNKPTPPLPGAHNYSSSMSASSRSSSNTSISTQATELTLKSEKQQQPGTPTIKLTEPPSSPKKESKPAPQKQHRPKKYAIPPLTRVHFACYQSHRYFAASNNSVYPVPCMTCLKVDEEIRWRCTFCCLRICGECMQLIDKCKRRSLKELMERLLRALEGAEGA
ncbi:hypothetical protein AJ79_05264 [Helicocarpus griseus UAMH5409]|uniref:Uncharacterized protein n=1 Tax=Helicocarpus griseus UAMH5409 TaxID=1447875 RepID=A0A2B7XPT0_9EURO|nr:hypothetical protein AJ79_05264 [Helicocarpus griseus UAMH5409]